MTTSDVQSKPFNPVLMAASRNIPSIVTAILSYHTVPPMDVNERDNNHLSALGYVIQNINGNINETTSAALALIAAGAQLEAQEPDLQAQRIFDEHKQRHYRPTLSLPLLAIRNAEGPWLTIFEHLGPQRLKNLSLELPLLHEALRKNLRVASDMLVKAGVDVNQEDPILGRPIACCRSASDLAMLIAAGAKINVIDSKGRSALELISASNASAEVLSMATTAALAESRGKTALFKEGQQTLTKASDDIAQPLIDALFFAIAHKKTERIESLWKTLNLSRDKTRMIDARDKNGQNLLHCALTIRNFPLARRLIKHGLSPDVFDHNRQTPLSSLFGLEYQRTERDASGGKRSKIFLELLSKVKWDSRSPLGFGYYEALLCVSLERLNGVLVKDIFDKVQPTLPDWLEMSDSTSTCTLSRVLAQAVSTRRAPYDSILEFQEMKTPMYTLLQQHIERPDFGPRQAHSLLTAALSSAQNTHLLYPLRWLTQTLDVIESQLDTFKATGVDPGSIAWAPSLATSRPSLFAALESWHIAGSSLGSSAPRARIRSL